VNKEEKSRYIHTYNMRHTKEAINCYSASYIRITKIFRYHYFLPLARAGRTAADLERKSTRVNIVPIQMLNPSDKLSDKLKEGNGREAEML